MNVFILFQKSLCYHDLVRVGFHSTTDFSFVFIVPHRSWLSRFECISFAHTCNNKVYVFFVQLFVSCYSCPSIFSLAGLWLPIAVSVLHKVLELPFFHLPLLFFFSFLNFFCQLTSSILFCYPLLVVYNLFPTYIQFPCHVCNLNSQRRW